ncbi:MAG: phage tail tube protein [Henriciella sp.]|nr:phage tail tube protein [Henriciella sp.]
MPTGSSPRGRGVQHLALRHETTFGEPVAGDFVALRFYSNSLEERSPLSDDNVLGAAISNQRDVTEHEEALPTVTGDIVVPVGEIEFGYWLSLLFGQPVTTPDGDDFVHVWESGADILPTATLEEVRRPGKHKVFNGVAANSLNLVAQKESGKLQATIGLIGRSENPFADASIAGDIVRPGGKFFSRHSPGYAYNGASESKVISFGMALENGIVADPFMDGSPYAGGMSAGPTVMNATLRARYSDETWQDRGREGGYFSHDVTWKKSENLWLKGEFPAARVEKRSAPTTGPGFEDLDFTVRGKQSDTAPAARFTLKNTHPSYDMPVIV